jgi:hypothetical protein
MADSTESAALPDRTFGWWDMWARPDGDPRETGGPYSGERETLVRYLRDRRLTLQMKCEDLDAEGMARRSVPPSNMSLLGLVRHLADVERSSFRRLMAGEDAPARSPGGTDFEEATADPAMVEEAWATWRAEVEFAEEFMATAPGLDILGAADQQGHRGELREILIQMIEEYARHNGHADLIRERIDGRIGQ